MECRGKLCKPATWISICYQGDFLALGIGEGASLRRKHRNRPALDGLGNKTAAVGRAAGKCRKQKTRLDSAAIRGQPGDFQILPKGRYLHFAVHSFQQLS